MSSESAELKIDLESVSPNLLAELVDLYSGQSYKQALWPWQFMPRFDRKCLAITARESGRLVGFNGLMPVQLARGEQVIAAWWSCDFVVDPGHQGQGIGSRMKETMLQRVSEPVLSLGISAQAWPILLNKGWKPGPPLSLYERVFTPLRRRQWLFKSWSEGLAAFQKIKQNFAPNAYWRLESSDQLPDPGRVEALWQTWRPRYECSVVRNYAYLQWRYDSFPFRLYRYIYVFNAKIELRGLLVYRYDGEGRVEVTDYLGPSSDQQLVRLLTQKLREQGAKAVLWRTEVPGLKRLLALSGYIKKRYATRFVYRSLSQDEESKEWHLTSGDSDGDFLNAACDHVMKERGCVNDPGEYQLRELESDSFSRCRKMWDDLLKQSTANPLFMSWQWQYSWWLVWGRKLGLKLRCYSIYSDQRLVGILPLFQRRSSALKPNEYQFLGNVWRSAPTVRSEYIAPIFAQDHESALYAFLENQWVTAMPAWSCLIVPDHVGPMAFWHKALVRQEDHGCKISTLGNIEVYLAQLGKNTRLRAFNRQEYLRRQYPDTYWGEFDTSEGKAREFFKVLNDFHVERWGVPCFFPDAVDFHCQLICQGGKEIKPLLHYLEVSGRIRSVSYNLCVKGVMYNLQSGFEADFDSKLSLGTLHIGKLIGLSFSDPEIQAIDLLAGTGMRTDYKDHFKGERVHFNSVQIFSSRYLFSIYRFLSRSKAKLRTGERRAS